MAGEATIARAISVVANTPKLLFDTPANGALCIYQLAMNMNVASYMLARIDDGAFTWSAAGPENVMCAHLKNDIWAEAQLPAGGLVIDASCGLYIFCTGSGTVMVNVRADRYMEIAP